MTIADMSRFYGPDYTQPGGTGGDGIGPEYTNWDAQSTTACYCDQGHFGADCSNREWDNADRSTCEPPKAIASTKRSRRCVALWSRTLKPNPPSCIARGSSSAPRVSGAN